MQTIEKIKLDHLPRCDQEWLAMPPCEGGRKCLDCKKTIVDFTAKTPLEIARIHALSDDAVCGMYSEEQLSPLQKKEKHLRSNSPLKVLLLTFLGLSSNSIAQEIEKKPKIHQTTVDSTPENPISLIDEVKDSIPSGINHFDSLAIGGKISIEGEPLIGANLFFEELNIGTTSDLNGDYLLTIDRDVFEHRDSLTLVVSYIGAETQYHALNKGDFQNGNQSLDFELNHSLHLISFGIVRPKWHQRIWYKIKSIF